MVITCSPERNGSKHYIVNILQGTYHSTEIGFFFGKYKILRSEICA